MIYRTIIFTNSPLLRAIRYGDRFQLVPFFYFHNAQITECARHFPAYLEYEAEKIEECSGIENELRKKGVGEDVIQFGKSLPNQERVKREIIQLLTCITNFRFFEYDFSDNGWGIQTPLSDIKELSSEELKALDNQTSHWTIHGYYYPGLKEDLKISAFTQCTELCKPHLDGRSYFTNNPNIENNPEISIPPNLEFCLDRYYGLPDEQRKRVKHCLGLLSDGIALFDTKRSVSLLAIVSSIETMALLDYELYGQAPKLGPMAQFTRYLKRYVAGHSEDKFKSYYKKRCEITHEGSLFLGDIDIYADLSKQHEDWMLRLEIMQAARMALYNWLIKAKSYI